jgi:threonine dehydrogenase-like Zn-dependent dehydrogenase
LAGVKPGDSVVIYGAGWLMAAHSASIKGASKVMVVDSHPDRLKLAEELGAIPDFSKGSAVEQVLELPKAWVLIRVANA